MMMPLDTVATIGREVAAEYNSRLDVIGVASGGGDSGRVELLVEVQRSGNPSVVMLNVTREERGAFERDLREKFRDALR